MTNEYLQNAYLRVAKAASAILAIKEVGGDEIKDADIRLACGIIYKESVKECPMPYVMLVEAFHAQILGNDNRNNDKTTTE